MSDNESLHEGSNSVTGTVGQAPGTVNIGLETVAGRQISAGTTLEQLPAGIHGTTKCD